MSIINKMLFLYAEEMIHPGGEKGRSYIDNPIQREAHTGFPKLRGRGIKSSIKDIARNKKMTHLDKLFGSDDNGDVASCLTFSDGRLLLFPVRSARNIFAWITCPYVLNRLHKDLKKQSSVNPSNVVPELSARLKDNECWCIDGGKSIQVGNKGKIVLEEYVFSVVAPENGSQKDLTSFAQWTRDNIMCHIGDYWGKKIMNDLVLVSDNAFYDLVSLYTPVEPGNKINPETHTVEEGKFFQEEFVPQETIFYSIASAGPEFSKSPEFNTGEESYQAFSDTVLSPDKNSLVMQLGGSYTTNKGIVTGIFIS